MTYVDARRLISRIQVIYIINLNTTNNFTTSSRTKELLRRFWDKLLNVRKGYNYTQSWEEGCQTVSISTIDCTHPNAYLVLCIPFEYSCVSITDIRITVTLENAHSVKNVFLMFLSGLRYYTDIVHYCECKKYPSNIGYTRIKENEIYRVLFLFTVALSQLGSEI